MTSQQMRIYQYVLLQTTDLQQQVSVIAVTIGVSYNKKTINIQIIVQDTLMVVTGVTETLLNKFTNVQLLVYRISIKHSLVH
jgi:hypothetical protein